VRIKLIPTRLIDTLEPCHDPIFIVPTAVLPELVPIFIAPNGLFY
jgi:hypothetical protein